MHDTLSPSAHGLVDYMTVLVFALAPTLFQFDGIPALLAYGLAGVHLVLTLSTRFPMGMFDGIPLRAHGALELVVSVALIILPWVAGFIQPGAQWFFPFMGIFVFLVWLLSDYGRLTPAGEVSAVEAAVEDASEDASIPGGRRPESVVGPGDRDGPTGTAEPGGPGEREAESESARRRRGEGEESSGPSSSESPRPNEAGGSTTSPEEG